MYIDFIVLADKSTMAVVTDIYRGVNNYLNKYQDPRTADWFLMSSPFPTLGICLSYVFIVKVLGPKLMENRKPFNLKTTLIYYNFAQVVFSIWLFYQIGISGWFTGEYSFRCQPVDYSNKPSTIRMVHASWWYFFSKFTEFLDTIFFVMRKKNDHVSTLHVIHHGIMPMSVWFGVKYTPGGHSTFFGFINTFVHIIMYTYYMLSAMGPHMQKYLWWKRYLTTFQMVQFVAIMIHAFQLLFIDCNYPRAFVWWIGMHAVMFFFLFKEFYNQTYIKRRLSEEKKQKEIVANEKKQNGYTNGHVEHNGVHKNGISNVSEYYVSGTSDIHKRINL
ncbi:elongation of very long chain fatty acids protein AAEL008004-like isoform X1 [Diorhabda carinulata]|uniref:elongation of very long chain fatty acids protein AAEL008004-like isoform X1 n=2 Tax=Diorhabda carinulata TaxID=1163345 RepID=UPI0025A26C8F|nr:elongation of very long chain fatty acids protein AAEL008004-like isoform X1 [Diorhabda carinulata]